MFIYTPRQYVELFHLLFIDQLGRKLNKKFYALKGGCNMRFFFKSPRYSEDIDLDVQSIAVAFLREKVNNILSSKPFRDILQVRDIEIEHITEHKQTETTQRWKLGLIVPHIEKTLPTKIEFSRRGLEKHIKFEPISPEVIRFFELSPILINHYPAEITCQQKLKALISRKTVQARDIFDLYLLLASRVERVDLPEEVRANLDKAKERILSMDFRIFKSQVISYLESEDQPRFESEEVWDNIRLHVIETLSED
ncbi:MAG: nucleotidyl transferase AbiEii/AbiGii toxin family protein [Candidatus Aminicenantes bacterium]|nr:nucleotidyl transferase AbiEii/AbiGii toxin family protein [Candidatus Aminicenantes bacterium]